jgi:integrase
VPVEPKYDHLKQDPNISLWYSNHAKLITANEQLRRLGLFCEIFNTTPQAIVALGKPPAGTPDNAKKWIIGKVAELQARGYKGNYVANFVKSLKSWLEFSEVHLPPRPPINIRGRGKNKKYAKEKPPTPQELQILLEIADPRQKVAISLMAFSGFRPRTIGNYRGDDGLRISDFPEMHVDFQKRTVRFEVYDQTRKEWVPKIPTMVTVREEINKGENRAYVTFLNKQACDHVQMYLEDRMTTKEYRVYDNNGKPVRDPKTNEQLRELRAEKLTLDSPIIGHNHPYRLNYWKEKVKEDDGREVEINYYSETFVPAQNISYAIISPVIQTLGLKRPDGEHDRSYVLRTYFADQIMRAEADKKIGVIYSWRQLWMGHSEGIEAVYTTEKTIPEEIIEQMRKAYEEASDAYLTIPQTRMISIEEASTEYKRMFLIHYKGWGDDEVYKLGDLSLYTFQQLEAMEDKLKTAKGPAGEKRQPPQKRILVPERDLKKINMYFEKGYQPLEKKYQVVKGQVIFQVPRPTT